MYRLAVFPLHVPPLRERAGDVPLLAEHFLMVLNRTNNSQKRFSAAFLDALRTYRWAGNVRELKNAVERSFILADDVLEFDLPIAMPAPMSEPEVRPAGLHVPLGSRLDEAERSLIEVTLGLYFTATVFYALATGIYGTLPFLVLFQVGFLYTGLLSIIQQFAGDAAVLKPMTEEEL